MSDEDKELLALARAEIFPLIVIAGSVESGSRQIQIVWLF